MHDLNNIQNLGQQQQQSAVHGLEVAGGLYALNHMLTVQQQNADLLYQQQMIYQQQWIQTQLLAGRSMDDIRDEIAEEEEQYAAYQQSLPGPVSNFFRGILTMALGFVIAVGGFLLLMGLTSLLVR